MSSLVKLQFSLIVWIVICSLTLCFDSLYDAIEDCNIEEIGERDEGEVIHVFFFVPPLDGGAIRNLHSQNPKLLIG